MNSRGFTPAAYSSGERRRQGGITKAGHLQTRRALIDGAWAYRYPATVSRPLHRRLEKVPQPIQDMSWQAQVRLCKHYRPLLARGKNANQVVGAIARELRAFLWAIAQEVPLTPETETVERPQSIARGSDRASEEPRPRCGAALDGVKRLQQPLVPQRGRHPTDARKVGAHPRIAAGATVVYDWLRLCRWTKDQRTKNMQKHR